MRIGILGGTFNPIHNAHLAMADCARDRLALDRVLLMVAADPPHKQVDGAVSGEHRLRMTRLAAETLERVEASDFELRRPGKSYTAETLALLHAQFPDASFYWIVGSDMLQDLPTWYRPEEILRLAEIAAVPRIGASGDDEPAAERLRTEYGAHITMLPACAEAISSTEIRQLVRAGRSASMLVPAAVERYYTEEGLYLPPGVAALQARVRADLPEKRFRHTCGVMIEAARLAERWGADPEKARLAALLHDCAKYLPHEELLRLSDGEPDVPPVLHAFAGAAVARTVYGVDDADVLQAIRLHSTGDADMTLLDKLVYLADLTEPGRDFPGVERFRAACALGPDEAMRLALRGSAEVVRRTGGAFHPASARALAWFEQMKKGEKTE